MNSSAELYTNFMERKLQVQYCVSLITVVVSVESPLSEGALLSESSSQYDTIYIVIQ